MNTIEEALAAVRKFTRRTPDIGLILGSGLGDLAEEVTEADRVPYRSLPHFPISTVAGHKGQFVIGEWAGKSVAVMQGRYHHYEGYSLRQVAFPVEVMRALGVRRLIVTNAAGGINLNYLPGDLMLIRDHINLLGTSPLIGPNDAASGPRFPDMSAAYDTRLLALARRVAGREGIVVHEGVYLATPGPQYETPAEIRMMRTLGADAVGMSTVPEVIAARHAGVAVIGISCITNMGSGVLNKPLSHTDVVETAARAKDRFTRLVRGIIREM